MRRKQFDQKLYNAVDKKEFDLINDNIKPFDQQNYDDVYLIDYPLFAKGKLVALLELEWSSKFHNDQWGKYRINFMAHKVVKYGDKDYSKNVFGIPNIPTYYVMINNEFTHVAITKFSRIDTRIEAGCLRMDVPTCYGLQDFYTNNMVNTDIIAVKDIGTYFRLELYHPSHTKEGIVIPQK